MLTKIKTNTKENITFEKLTEEWLLYKKHQIKESSYYRYKYIIEKYISEILKNTYIKDLEIIDINLIIEELFQKYNRETVRNIIIELKSIFNFAENKYNINLKKKSIITPKTNSKKINILQKDHEDRIKRYCNKSIELRDIGIVMCLYTGMRIGEICALIWKDIDLENRQIHINKTLERIYLGNKKTIIYIGESKSKASIRTVPITNYLFSILIKLKKTNKYKADVFFLTGSSERFIEPRNYQYWFKKRLKLLNYQKDVKKLSIKCHYLDLVVVE